MPGAAEQASAAEKGADADLFTTPADLCCPITLCPFLDPVLTAAGQVRALSLPGAAFDNAGFSA